MSGLAPDQFHDTNDADLLFALRSLDRRHRDLSEEITALKQRILSRATAANPGLLAIKGTGPVVDTHLAKGWAKSAVYRALKRAVAREVFSALTAHCAVPDYIDLRPAPCASGSGETAVM